MPARKSPSPPPRWLLAGLGLLWMLSDGWAAGPLPLATSEIGLMLRSGYTSGEVLQEVATRHVLEPLDAAGEKTLRDDGANQPLIDALRSGRYTLPAEDSAAVKSQQQAAAARVQAARAAGQDQLLAQAREQAQAAVSRRVANQLRGKLVIWKDGRLQPYDDNILSTKKVFAFYYSASWCGPCQQFTPWLIQFYRQFAPSHPQFEVVFISDDHSAEDMQKYMQADDMPFPALEFARKPQEPELTRNAGPGIPSLVLVDGAGGVLSDSYDGTKYLGPRHVIEDLAKMAGIQLKADTQNPPPMNANQPPAPARANPGLSGRAVTLSGQPQ